MVHAPRPVALPAVGGPWRLRPGVDAVALVGADDVHRPDLVPGLRCETTRVFATPVADVSLGWKHAVALWPEVFDDETQYARVLEGLKRTRPVVETGFENTLLARCILEKTHSADAIVNDWGALMPELMERWQLDRAEMVSGYGAIRDDWMAADLESWLEANLMERVARLFILIMVGAIAYFGSLYLMRVRVHHLLERP